MNEYLLIYNPSPNYKVVLPAHEPVILKMGMQGPPGPPGVGKSDANFIQEFSNTNQVVVFHNLGKYPAVTFQDSAGTEYKIEVQHDSINQLTAQWNGLATGRIICN